MKKYDDYRAVDFAEDEAFIRWVKYGSADEALSRQWNTWLMHHLDKREMIDEARAMVQSVLQETQFSMTDQHKHALWSRIQDSVEQLTPVSEIKKPKAIKTPWYSLAAMGILVALAGVYVFFHFKSEVPVNTISSIAIEEGLIQCKNDSGIPQVVVLEDGSRVTMQPKSVLAYPKKFIGYQRKVYLSGEAFFNVEKDPKRPFFVYANELVTQVLGTSFNVRAYEQERNISVVVRTGKVSVFSWTKDQDLKDSKETAPASKVVNRTLLLPNQQVVFSRDQASMIKSLVLEPVVLPVAPTLKLNFEFTDTPIRQVFDQLEAGYGVDIVYDEDIMNNCFLNASLSDLSFHDKLRLICKAINAQYEMLDARIIITGSGCQ